MPPARSVQPTSDEQPAPEGAYPDHLRREVESYLAALRFSQEPLTAGLDEAMRYSLLAGGKRIRPVLSLATARALGLDHEQVLPLAGAIELIHTYSLIHDDLPAMDDDDLRRGRPTCHRAFGEDVAILAGDGLYAEAFVLLLSRQEAPPDRLLAAASALALATGAQGMVAGQYIDVAGTALPGPDGLRRLHELKTGRLIAANAGVLGAEVILVHERPDGRRFLVLDAAMNDLIRPAMYDAYHDIRPVAPRAGAAGPYDVVGPICETGDTFTRDRELPPLEAGDLVAFMTAGAYGAAMSSEYNSRLLVPEVLVKGGEFAVVRPRPSYDEMLARETPAPWLAAG